MPTHFTIRSPIMTDAVWCTPTCGITYSVLPSCRMLFGASRHVVSLIRFSHHDGFRLVHPDTLYHLFGSPIMPDAIWCILTRGITYSVLSSCWMLFGASRHVVSLIRFSHHAGCCLVHPDTWYQLNSICHQDGCRLVHPAKWDISSMPYAIMTDADWCIPPSGTLENFGVPS